MGRGSWEGEWEGGVGGGGGGGGGGEGESEEMGTLYLKCMVDITLSDTVVSPSRGSSAMLCCVNLFKEE